jgi:UDP-glucose 4-epimerase
MYLKDKVVLITGGTGSMGKTFVRRILTGELGLPKKIIVMSRDEAKQHYMRLSYLHKGSCTDEVIYRNFLSLLEFRIGDVRNYGDVCSALRGVDVVINAAALKQVPTCEYFPEQAVLTNIIGPTNIARAIRELNLPVETVLGVSTDKAVKPINVMGMTKSIQEKVFVSANILSPHTRFLCVRYGNVLASRGSVIPLFHDQIHHLGPVTVTDERMTRFLLSLDDAVDTVFNALRHGSRGDTFVPIPKSATVLNIAHALIGKRRIEVKVTGIRPGEKLHESMVSEEEAPRTIKVGNYYIIKSMLPELVSEPVAVPALSTEFTSADTLLSKDETYELLSRHRLLIEQTPNFAESDELLR